LKTRDVEPHSSDVAAQIILSEQMQCTFSVSVQGIGFDKIIRQPTSDHVLIIGSRIQKTLI
jgi:hypothetical protein